MKSVPYTNRISKVYSKVCMNKIYYWEISKLLQSHALPICKIATVRSLWVLHFSTYKKYTFTKLFLLALYYFYHATHLSTSDYQALLITALHLSMLINWLASLIILLSTILRRKIVRDDKALVLSFVWNKLFYMHQIFLIIEIKITFWSKGSDWNL